MKTKLLTIGLSLVGVMAFAQKKEIRNAGKAIEDKNYKEAKMLLTSVESLIPNEKEKIQLEFYQAKAKAYLGEGKSKSLEELLTAGEAYKKVIALGEKEEGELGLDEVGRAMVNSAVQDQQTNNYKGAANKLYASYKLNPKDTTNLYFAASSAATGKDYDTALKYYNQLMDLGYTGKGVEYSAINKATDERQPFGTKEERDRAVKIGVYSDPEDKVLTSKVGEITKNIAVIYLQNGEEEKAMEAIAKAKKANPNDTALMLAEANIYYKKGDMSKYSSLVEKVLEKDPTNADLYFNLGVTAYEMKNVEKAKEYYKKAIQNDPSMNKAYTNLAYTILMKEQEIIDQMNSLGMSDADSKKYEQLSEKRKNIYREAVPYLEKAIEMNPEQSEDMKKNLYNIYLQIGEDAKAKTLKAKM